MCQALLGNNRQGESKDEEAKENRRGGVVYDKQIVVAFWVAFTQK
jgi:hypothetical protein